MSLLTTATLVVTPNANKTGKLYSVIPSNGNGDFTVTRATTATRVNSAGLVEVTGTGMVRLDYSNGTCPSLLVEPQRTNLALYSQQFDNAYWDKYNTTITANNAVAPDGTTSADRLVLSGTSADSRSIYKTAPIVTTTTTVTFSTFVKYVDKQFIQLVFSGGFSSQFANFDLINGTVTNGTYVSANVQSYANGWYRISITTTGLNTFCLPFIWAIDTALALRASNSTSTGTSAYLIWGAQIEDGSYPTSYIPTTSASVTRNADVVSKTGISSLIGQTEGTLFAEIEVSKLLGTASRYVFHISDGTTNNRIYMAFSGSSSNVLRGRIFNGGTLQCSIDTSTITSTGTYKLALAYKNNDIVFYVNGVQIGVDTSATIPTCSRVDLGQNYANTSQLGDGIKASALWETRLTNTQLAQLTTI